MSLTPQREKFAQAVASGMNQSDAYRAAYRVRHGTTMVSVNQSASRVMADVNVASMVAELRAPAAKKASITLESHLVDLQSLSNMAVKEKQFAAAITAEVARRKAAGVHIERADITNSDGCCARLVRSCRPWKAAQETMFAEFFRPPAGPAVEGGSDRSHQSDRRGGARQSAVNRVEQKSCGRAGPKEKRYSRSLAHTGPQTLRNREFFNFTL